MSQVIETEDKAVFKAIQDGIDRYNTNLIISNAQKVNRTPLLEPMKMYCPTANLTKIH